MKNLKIIALLSLLPGVALAGPMEDQIVKELGALNMAERVASSETVAMRLGYGGSATEAYVTILNSGIIFQAPNGTLDTSVGGDGNGRWDFSLSTSDTMGEVCDAIDNTASYSCQLVAGKRDDGASLLRNVLSTPTLSGGDLKADNGYEVKVDTGGNDHTQLVSVLFGGIGIQPQSGRFVRLKKCSWNANGNTLVKVFGKLRKHEGAGDGLTRDDTTLAWDSNSFDDATMQTNFSITVGTANAIGSFVELNDGALDFAKDAHVVVRNANGTDIQSGATVSAPNFVDCVWEER